MQDKVEKWMSYGTRVSGDQWNALATALPGNIGTRLRNDDGTYLRFIEAVLWVAETGAFWIDLPAEFGPARATYVRFGRWHDKGVWDVLAETLGGNQPLAQALILRSNEHALRASRLRSKRENGKAHMRSRMDSAWNRQILPNSARA